MTPCAKVEEAKQGYFWEVKQVSSMRKVHDFRRKYPGPHLAVPHFRKHLPQQ